MGTSKNISEKKRRLYENTIRSSVSPDFVYCDEVPSKEKEQQKDKSQVLQHLSILLEAFFLFYDMTEEELQVFHEKIKCQKSERKIAEIIRRSNKTVKNRWLKCIGKIEKYLGISSEFDIQKCLQGIQKNNNQSHDKRGVIKKSRLISKKLK